MGILQDIPKQSYTLYRFTVIEGKFKLHKLLLLLLLHVQDMSPFKWEKLFD